MVDRDIKYYLPFLFAGLGVIYHTVFCLLMLMVPIKTCAYAPNVIFALL